jgi:hypothetical protein
MRLLLHLLYCPLQALLQSLALATPSTAMALCHQQLQRDGGALCAVCENQIQLVFLQHGLC